MARLLDIAALMPLFFTYYFVQISANSKETYCVFPNNIQDKKLDEVLEECDTVAFPTLDIHPQNWSLVFKHDKESWKRKDGKIVIKSEPKKLLDALKKKTKHRNYLLTINIDFPEDRLMGETLGDNSPSNVKELVEIARRNGYDGILVWHGSLYQECGQTYPAYVMNAFLDHVQSAKTALKWHTMKVDLMVNSDVCKDDDMKFHKDLVTHYVISSADFSYNDELKPVNPLKTGDTSIAETLKTCHTKHRHILPKTVVVLHSGMTVYTVDSKIRGGEGYVKNIDFYGYQEACEVLQRMSGLEWAPDRTYKEWKATKDTFHAYLDTITSVQEKVEYLEKQDIFGIGMVIKSWPERGGLCDSVKYNALKVIKSVILKQKERMDVLTTATNKAFKITSRSSKTKVQVTKLVKTLCGKGECHPDYSRTYSS